MIGHYFGMALRRLWRHKGSALIKLCVLSLGFSCFLGAYGTADYYRHTDSGFANADRIYLVAQRVVTAQTPHKPEMTPQSSPPLAGLLAADYPGMVVGRIHTGVTTAVTAGAMTLAYDVEGFDRTVLRMLDMPFVSGGGVDALDRPGSVVIPRSLALRLFGRQDVTGETLRLDQDITVTITGVVDAIAPPTIFGADMLRSREQPIFASMDVMDALQAPRMAPGFGLADSREWVTLPFLTLVMLPEDGSLSRARLARDLAGFGKRHVSNAVAAEFGLVPLTGLAAASIDAGMLDNQSGVPFPTMLTILGLVILMVACLNFSNLMAAEAVGRAQETGLHRVLGASRRQLLMPGLMETLLLGLLAVAVALGLFEGLATAVNQPVDRGLHLPSLARLDFWAGLAAAMVFAVALACGYPAFILSRIRPARALGAGRSLVGASLMRTLLIGVQFTVAGFLLAGMAVVHQQNRHVREASIGGVADPTVVISNSLTLAGVDPALFDTQMRAGPGIREVTRMAVPPFGTDGLGQTFARTPDAASPGVVLWGRTVSYDYFQTLGVGIIAGRDFSKGRTDSKPAIQFTADTGAEALQASINRRGNLRIILDRAAVKALGWRDPNAAIGQMIYRRLNYGPNGVPVNIPHEVIGVVGEPPLEILSMGNRRHGFMVNTELAGFALIRIESGRQREALAHIERTWKTLAPGTPLRAAFLEDRFRDAFSYYRTASGIVLGLGILAGVIAAMGLVGMAGFIVRRRLHEIGVRKTLGARSGQVLWLLLWDFSKPVIVANILAWPLVWLAAQAYLSVFTSRISITPLPFIGGMLATLVIAWLAVGGQAWRAARVQPARVLRYE